MRTGIIRSALTRVRTALGSGGPPAAAADDQAASVASAASAASAVSDAPEAPVVPPPAAPLGRAEKLLGGLDLGRGRCAEIGALDKPLITRTQADVIYVDYADADTLRADHAGDTNVDTQAIQVDAVWRHCTLAQAIYGDNPPPREQRLSCVLASHVIEHVPDLVLWLVEIHQVLQPEGQLRLAIPDCRYSFDILRRPSNLADVLAAFIQGDKAPSVRAVLDHCLHAVSVDAAAVWRGEVDRAALRTQGAYTFARCMEAARDRQEHQGYYPVHCWTFTPRSLAEICAELARHDLLDLACVHWHDTEVAEAEFFVTLQPCAATEERVRSWQAMAEAVRG